MRLPNQSACSREVPCGTGPHCAVSKQIQSTCWPLLIFRRTLESSARRVKESTTSNCDPRRFAKIIWRDIAIRYRFAGAHAGSVPAAVHKTRYLYACSHRGVGVSAPMFSYACTTPFAMDVSKTVRWFQQRALKPPMRSKTISDARPIVMKSRP